MLFLLFRLVGCNIVLMKHFLPVFMLTGLLLGQDTTIVLENGRTLKGTIVSETDSTYRIMGESWRVTDGVYEVFNTFINISKNETVEEKELSKQDVLLHKSGKNYKGTFIGKVDENIIFKIEGEKSNSAFSINDVDIVITSRGGIKVELYYPFDIPTKQEYHPKSSYQELPDIIKIILGGGTCYISLYLFYLLIDATNPGM